MDKIFANKTTMGKDDETATNSGKQSVNVDAKLLAKEVSSLAVATDVRPPLFSGKAGENISTWIRRFETVATALEWDHTRQLSQVGVYLTAFAGSWYSKITRDGTNPFPSWSAFRNAIIARFQAEDYKAQLKRQLNLRKFSTDESIEDYYNDVLTLCDQYDRDMEDADIVERLMNGLYPELMSRVCISHAATPMAFLSDIQKALVSIRKENRYRVEREKGQQSRPYTDNYRKSGFAVKESWKFNGQGAQGNSQPNISSSGNQNNGANGNSHGGPGGTGSGNGGKSGFYPRANGDRPPVAYVRPPCLARSE